MLDLKFIRENPEIVKKNTKKKFQDPNIVDKFLKKDKAYRKLLNESQNLRKQRNDLTNKISEKKKAKENPKKLFVEAKKLAKKIKSVEENIPQTKQEIDDLLWSIPNIMARDVPLGKDHTENIETGKYGKPKKFTFSPKNHVDLAENLGVVDFDGAARVAGKGFFYLIGDLALLNQALIRYTIDFMLKKNYAFIEPPLMLNREHVLTVMPSIDFEQHAYKIDGKDQYLIATSEHPLVAWFQNQVIDKSLLPIKLFGYSQCFRQEIGSHGIEEKGLFRTHQFNKVEQVVICDPEDSDKFYKEILKNSIDLYRKLGIPIRTLECCSGDLGDLKYKSEDVEVWSPTKNEYYEVGSCSNLTDAQARRANIKVFDGKDRFTPHTLNNTAIATSRCMVAILENYQQKDGSVKVPAVLQKYMNKKVIGKNA